MSGPTPTPVPSRQLRSPRSTRLDPLAELLARHRSMPAGAPACPRQPPDGSPHKEGARSMAASSLLAVPAYQALRQSPIPVLRNLYVEESEQEIVLSGAVSSYYLKQLAQE